jgi:heterodisulfide reductase subunit B
MAELRYAFYPGCSLGTTAKEFALSTRAVCRALDVDLCELDDWVCCGASAAHIRSELLGLALPLINLAAAEQQGRNVMTCCSACHNRMKSTAYELKENPELLAKLNAMAEENYRGETRVFNILEVLAREVGPETIQTKTSRPLTGLKVACYYGCLLTRLPRELRTDSAEHPVMMDELMAVAGAEPVDWPGKTECCGASLTLAGRPTVFRLIRDILQMARENGAECLAVGCPLCQANLDMYQSDAQNKYGDVPSMPVFYFTQLTGLAMGLPAGELGLDRLLVDPFPLLERRGLAEPEAV